jgi:hypothetical protein
MMRLRLHADENGAEWIAEIREQVRGLNEREYEEDIIKRAKRLVLFTYAVHRLEGTIRLFVVYKAS